MTREWHMRILVGFMLEVMDGVSMRGIIGETGYHTDGQVHSEIHQCPSRRSSTFGEQKNINEQ
jgi:hypothetical protein